MISWNGSEQLIKRLPVLVQSSVTDWLTETKGDVI